MKFKGNLFVYIVGGVLFYLFWLLVVFPYDALQSRVITEIENQTQGRYKVEMKDMGVSLLGSVTFKDLQVSERAGGQEALLLSTPKLKLGFSPFGLLSKKVDFSFYLKGKKNGDIEGDFRQTGEEMVLNMEIDEFPLSDLKFISHQGDLNFKGEVQGKVNIALNRADPSQNKGTVDVDLVNLTMDPTKVALDPSDPSTAMEIPQIKLTGSKGSHIKAQMQAERLKVDSITLTGGDLQLDLDGTVTLRGRSPGDYRIALKGGFKIDEKLAKALPFLFILEKQKNAEGVYPLSLSGRLSRPGIRIGKFRVPI